MIVLCTAVLLLACDKNGNPLEEFGLDKLQKGMSTEAEVIAAMGKPDTVWDDGDGKHTLEYPKGPEGVRTWMFSIGTDGKLTDYRQVLTDDNFALIRPGMSQEEVRRMLGRPRTIVPFKRMHEVVWDWRYLHIYENRFFNVHFNIDSGEVVRTSFSEISGH